MLMANAINPKHSCKTSVSGLILKIIVKTNLCTKNHSYEKRDNFKINLLNSLI